MHTLTFTDEQLGLLNAAIGELPHKMAVPLIQSINAQLQAVKATAEEEKAEKSPGKRRRVSPSPAQPA